MYWESNKLKVKRAWRDIVVYKVIWNDCRSLYQFFPYILNKVYETEIISHFPIYHFDTFRIHTGYHSYISKRVARKMESNIREDQRIQPFIIPKGAYYAVNEDGEIVSNKIMMV